MTKKKESCKQTTLRRTALTHTTLKPSSLKQKKRESPATLRAAGLNDKGGRRDSNPRHSEPQSDGKRVQSYCFSFVPPNKSASFLEKSCLRGKFSASGYSSGAPLCHHKGSCRWGSQRSGLFVSPCLLACRTGRWQGAALVAVRHCRLTNLLPEVRYILPSRVRTATRAASAMAILQEQPDHPVPVRQERPDPEQEQPDHPVREPDRHRSPACWQHWCSATAQRSARAHSRRSLP